MYDTQMVLAAIDQNRWPILALCSLAMICNYTWFFAAVFRGFKDKVYPIPIFCTLFWLCGDGSVVLDYDKAFHVIDHWYVKLFWGALTLTVACELVFLYMTLRFGRKEIAPSLSQSQFTVLILGGVALMAVAWGFTKHLIREDLFINYFHLANMAGPAFAWSMILSRRSRAGTSPMIWIAYTLMVLCWFTATALWFGEPFASPLYLAFYAAVTLSAAATAWIVMRMPAAVAEPNRGEARIAGEPSAGFVAGSVSASLPSGSR
ncbi:MAG: hypothetical protein ABW110_18985 [Steroidobacteraceae bacterium]